MERNIASFVCLLCLVCGALVRSPVSSSSQIEPVAPNAPRGAALIINEYLADPPDGAAGDANGDGTRDAAQDEFVELVNSGPDPQPIGGFTISDAAQVRFTFPADKIIPPGEAALVFGGGNPTGDFGNCTANGLVFASGGSGLSLNNGGDTITVRDSASAVVDTLSYGSVEGNANQSITRSPDVSGGFVPHSTAPGSNGALFSPGTRINGSPFTTTDPVIGSISPESTVAGRGGLEMIVLGQNFENGSVVRVDGSPVLTTFSSESELHADIPASATNSPGAREITVQNPDLVVSNAVSFIVLSPIGLNEFLADPPDGPAGDANGDGVRDSAQDEFVEIVNRTSLPIDVAGFRVSDADAFRFTFPAGAIIPGGEAAVIFGGGTPQGDFGNAVVNGLVFTGALSLNNGGDTITIADSDGDIIESFSFGSGEGNANQSINRNSDLVGTSFVTHTSVPGSDGRLFSPGALVTGTPFTIGPRISRINPDNVPEDSPAFNMTVDGSGFDGDSTVFIDQLSADTTFVNSSQVIVRVPESITSLSGAYTVRVRNANGNRSNPATLVVVPPPPELRSVVPRVVQIGAGDVLLLLSGENFEQGSVVLVEGAAVATTFLSRRELVARVPAAFTSSVGLRSLIVRNSDGQLSNTLGFEVAPLSARISSISPGQSVVGGPGFVLTVNGANYRPGAVVLFDGFALMTRFISETRLEAHVLSTLISQIGIRAVSVLNPDGGGSDQAGFRVVPEAPVITGLDPSSALEGSGELTVNITGEGFQIGVKTRAFREGRTAAILEARLVTPELIEARVPAEFLGTAGSVSIAVENPDTGFSNSVTLRVFIKDPLVINEFLADPPDGVGGDANGDGNRSAAQDEFVEIVNRTSEAVDISGYSLSNLNEVRHVFAAGSVIPAFEAAVVFGGGTPTGDFGNAGDNEMVFKASTGSLSLDNGGDTLTLGDAHGNIVQQVRFEATQGGANQSINRDPDVDGSIFVHHSAVSDSNSLFSPGSRASGAAFTTKPLIFTLNPAMIRLGSQGLTLVVSGAGFLPGAVVLFKGVPLETTRVSDAQLQAQVTNSLVAQGGAAEVQVRNPRGEISRTANFVIFDDPPRALKLTPPQTGTGAENLLLRIEGERFQQGAKVMISLQPMETRFVSISRLEATAPAGFFNRATELQVRVVNGDGNESEALVLLVENGPLIARLSKKKIKAGSGDADITIGGVAFKPGIELFIDDVPVPTNFVSDVTFTARIPALLTGVAGKLTLQARNSDGGRSNKATLKVVN